VSVLDNYYLPATHYVVAGTTVRWENYGFHCHTVTSDQGLIDSGGLGHRQTFSWTFSHPGRYGYFCRAHPRQMQGTVVVVR
jgi:plastocyanin